MHDRAHQKKINDIKRRLAALRDHWVEAGGDGLTAQPYLTLGDPGQTLTFYPDELGPDYQRVRDQVVDLIRTTQAEAIARLTAELAALLNPAPAREYQVGGRVTARVERIVRAHSPEEAQAIFERQVQADYGVARDTTIEVLAVQLEEEEQ